MTSHRRWAVAVATTVALTAPLCPNAFAASLTVCPSGCAYTQPGPAVSAAHDGDVIRMGPGAYRGGFTIDASVVLAGAGAGRTVIRGGGPVITVGAFGAAAQPTVKLSGITVTGGVARSSPVSPGAWALGGGIDIPPGADFPGGATVSIVDSAIVGNAAESAEMADGGGVDNWGTLALANTTVSGNRVTVTGPDACEAGGGGIESFGTLVLTGGAVSANAVELASAANCGEAQGGGVFLNAGSGSLADTAVSGNRVEATTRDGDATAFAGGIDAYDALTLRDSRVTGNRVRAATSSPAATANPTAGGIGVVYPGRATIARTSVSANGVAATAGSTGAAVAEAGGIQTTDTVLLDSLVDGNRLSAASAGGPASVRGAGIEHGNGRLSVTDSRVSANAATASGAGGQALGGGIWNDAFFAGPDPELELTRSAVTGNALLASPGVTIHGGGLFTAFPVLRAGSLLAGNRPDDCFGVCGLRAGPSAGTGGGPAGAGSPPGRARS